MSAFDPALQAHLSTGATHTCHAWSLRRRDGVVMGFTDHDQDLGFGGIVFRADSGLSALALAQGTGLSVDNSEAIGALSGAAISESDIRAGRYDGAEITAWMVQWDHPDQRHLVFRGHIGEMHRAGGAFQAELRGLAEVLNHPTGRIYSRNCGADLGDMACGVDLDTADNQLERAILSVDGNIIAVSESPDHASGWFAQGLLIVLDGGGAGHRAVIKRDEFDGTKRVLHLWDTPQVTIAAGDLVRLVAGCDKRFETCRSKFTNHLNFQGFPDIPGDDWISISPTSSGDLGGGSRR